MSIRSWATRRPFLAPWRGLAAALLLFAFLGCATSNPDDLPVPAPVPAPDPRIAELQTAMTELLERIDVLNHRIARLEEAPAEPRPAAVAPVREEAPVEPAVRANPERRDIAQPAGGETQQALIGAELAEDYRKAIVLFGRGKHAEARQGFEAVFEADPAGDLADNALFWIGETYFAAGDNTNAVRFYNRVVNEFSEQNKAPDALFKIALAQARTGDLALARKTLQQVIERYPFSSTASSAKAELRRIRF